MDLDDEDDRMAVKGLNAGHSRDGGTSLSMMPEALSNPQNYFLSHQHTFVDICGHWITSWRSHQCSASSILSALALLQPVAPHLAFYVDEIIRLLTSPETPQKDQDASWRALLSSEFHLKLTDISTENLEQMLLAVLRFLQFDNASYAPPISPVKLQPLLHHDSRPVRYLTIAIFRFFLQAADASMLSMIEKHLGKDPITGRWQDGPDVDYIFLPLWEEKRLENLIKAMASGDIPPTGRVEAVQRLKEQGELSPYTADIRGCLVPRITPSPRKTSKLVSSPTTDANLRTLAEALLLPDPILVTGRAGSGKTSVINDLANELGAEETMLTLHLNEQTDAKLLIGMYTTASTPGSFTWRAGVLTTAVREGRWVLIEDLDRAPAEILSVILPLLERRELLIPNRDEVVRAARSFRLIATIRSGLNSRGDEIVPDLRMLGARLWRPVRIMTPSSQELGQIAKQRYPLIQALQPMMMSVYDRIQSMYREPAFAAKSKISLGRPVTPRDLFKWCRRVETLLVAEQSQTGFEAVSATAHMDVFLEAVDCFAGSLQTPDARSAVYRDIGEEMCISPQRVDFMLRARIPQLSKTERTTQVGRCQLEKPKSAKATARSRSGKGSRPFAMTTHTLRLLEQVGVSIQMAEPVLLVGETGIGKTAVVQHLAEQLGQTLTTVNLSQQSESGDLLGGFKPVDARSLAIPMKDDFDDLFEKTFSSKKNQRYLDMLNKSIVKAQWSRAITLWNEALKMAEGHFGSSAQNTTESPGGGQPSKKRRLEPTARKDLQERWERFAKDVQALEVQLAGGSKGFAFKFVEGNIVKAVRDGGWVLLDEINLASADTLEGIADLLQGGGPDHTPSILLSETGEIERVKAHPDFRIFGAMNPATDVGKKDLPMGLRSRFTEIFVDSPDRELENLLPVVKIYLKAFNNDDERAASDVAQLYLDVKKMADENRLVDGASQRPHYSLRTLTRTLTYVTDIAPTYGLRRALFEGFSMSFLTLLDQASEALIVPLIDKYLLGKHKNVRSLMRQVPRAPVDGKDYVQFEQYWMLKGTFPIETQPHYIITPFVRRNMLNLIRATSTRRFPVLIQGPTSSGKTSMIEYLAKITGNRFVRINNHEHTDLQEYLGSYVSGDEGRLVFREGVLVQALREGHWVVLDELNLAPTDVLEALNRLLDDNRELLIPETQTIVRPHPNFMLFATQNPAGLYGGRKVLSRAFRNRFLELHFDDIPDDELETILRERTQIAPSFCAKIVAVYQELSRLRQSDRVFEQRNSFATLRDLFRWALRDADDREQLATNGYMLLAERVRKVEDRLEVKRVIEKVLKVDIDEASLFAAANPLLPQSPGVKENASGVVWTSAMRRLFVLVSSAIKNNEPVLLVGETGSGKTSVCQVLADACQKALFTVNAHQNTETGDLIGAQRPMRNRAAIESQLLQDLQALSRDHLRREQSPTSDLESLLEALDLLDDAERSLLPADILQRIQSNRIKVRALFQWSDGALVQAMKEGQFFLLDEISLADDSVLERLNSVLEPQRSLLLAEKGPDDSFVEAASGFQFLATMNPGGDYGKRELSPALRNRFTEIWVPPVVKVDDVLQIATAKLTPARKDLAEPLVYFSHWFGERFNLSASSSISIRDVLAWVSFINSCRSPRGDFALVQGAAMVFIDTLGANPAAMLAIEPDRILEERLRCIEHLSSLLGTEIGPLYYRSIEMGRDGNELTIGPFSIPMTNDAVFPPTSYNLDAPTTKQNAMRLIRALQVRKPILLEGNPGVGKTTLVSALAQAVGKPLTRVNLSEQTDLMDLFGSDVPVEGEMAGRFVWRDAAFLQAMQQGGWVLLDEMNLASQSVLEGLNACLDHRGQVYVAELGQVFTRHPDFVVFAAQNPHHQGGGRKGLPGSFVNRFTVVYADVFAVEDLMLICSHQFATVPKSDLEKLLRFVSSLDEQVVRQRAFATQGGPWEFNLRDVLRWLALIASEDLLLAGGTARDFLELVFTQRFRTEEDRARARSLLNESYPVDHYDRPRFHHLTPTTFQVGFGLMKRITSLQPVTCPSYQVTPACLPILESLMICIHQKWPIILVGAAGCGKSYVIKYLAALSGADLVELSLNADIDTMDLVGGYEQLDFRRHRAAVLRRLERLVKFQILSHHAVETVQPEVLQLLSLLQAPSEDRTCDLQVYTYLSALATRSPAPQWSEILKQLQDIIDQGDRMDKASFEWVDGTLITALEAGSWLVLDNANLCSASVLDRLNSLLEPNGVLSVNEQRTSTGEAKVITPHPNFRIFLTMDPKNGELSRAMRNRAVEIFMGPMGDVGGSRAARSLSTTATESQLSRYRRLRILESQVSTDVALEPMVEVALSHLSVSDLDLVGRWANDVQHGLLDLSDHGREILATSVDRLIALGQRDSLILKSGSDLSLRDSLVKFVDYRAQPIQPLINHPLLLSGDTHLNYSSPPFCIAGGQGLYSRALGFEQRFEKILQQCETMKGSERSRLARSITSIKRPGLAEESTRGIFGFVLLINLTVLYWELPALENRAEDIKDVISAMEHVLSLLHCTMDVVDTIPFDEGLFQAHLRMWDGLARALDGHENFPGHITDAIRQGLGNVVSISEMSSGLSMEQLWQVFRPATPSTMDHLQAILHLEDLAIRFDAISWKCAAPLEEIMSIRSSLGDALQTVRSRSADDRSLPQDIEDILAGLEARDDASTSSISPYFQMEFETLCQYHQLLPYRPEESPHRRPAALDPYVALLAQRASVQAQDFDATQSSFSRLLTDLTSYVAAEAGSPQHLRALQGGVVPSILRKTNAVGEVPLRQLDLLSSEIRILCRTVSRSSSVVTLDQTHALWFVLDALMPGITKAQPEPEDEDPGRVDDRFDAVDGFKNRPPDAKLPWLDERRRRASHFRRVMSSWLVPSVEARRLYGQHGMPDFANAARTWIFFSIGALHLFVPDRVFDPALKPLVVRQLYRWRQSSLSDQLEALRGFEREFTGEKTSLWIRSTEDRLVGLGPEPAMPSTLRPEISDLDEIQREFSTLLRTVVQPFDRPDFTERLLSSPDGSVSPELDLLQANVSRIIQRLSSGNRIYEDLTAPVVGFLRCLEIGLACARLASNRSGEQSASHSLRRCAQTPFLGGEPRFLFGQLVEHLDDQRDGVRPKSRKPYLEWIVAVRSVESETLRQPQIRSKLLGVFHRAYDEWKEELAADQQTLTDKHGLYRYQAGEDDAAEADDADMAELFPDFDVAATPTPKTTHMDATPSERASDLAELHGQVMMGVESVPEHLLRIIQDASMATGSAYSSDAEDTLNTPRPEELLCGLILSLDRVQHQLHTIVPPTAEYRFYVDPNLAEAKSLVRLVSRIQARFGQLREAWPEHATLHDVLQTCDELLQFRHVEPVAKFLTKAEKLYGYMHEWQVVASKEYTAITLFDDLTALLVSWRRLELSSWPRLFDMEKTKCERDAKSWWFVAYEVIIAVPLSLVDEAKDLKNHAAELLSALETFFATTTLGQFAERLQMLRHFREHLSLISMDQPSFAVLVGALTHFISFYARFEGLVHERLLKGQQGLEKDMKEVVLLASWKDTNITALRESAKRSHHRLFKIVRKYRALLGQPVDVIIQQGLPESHHHEQLTRSRERVRVADVDPAAIARCQRSLTSWSTRPARFVKIRQTVDVMIQTSQVRDAITDGEAYLESFSAHLIASMEQLKKETPSTLTDENRESVKHLKSRKRVLFADTLKALRRMGLQHHLDATTLEQQDDMAKVLAKAPPLPTDTPNIDHLDSAASYFLQVTDLLSRTRRSLTNHSDDLTGAEITRSLGYLEGFMSTLIRQQQNLAESLDSLTQLNSVSGHLGHLWAPEEYIITTEGRSSLGLRKRFQRVVLWLPSILAVGLHLITLHGQLGDIDVSDLRRALSARQSEFKDLVAALHRLPAIPEGLGTSTHDKWYLGAETAVDQLRTDLERSIDEYPLLRFIVDQILPWTDVASFAGSRRPQGSDDEPLKCQAEELDASLIQACDSILVGLQTIPQSLSTLPSSTQDASWLVGQEATLAMSIRNLHAHDVILLIKESFDEMSRVELRGDDKAMLAAAVSALAAPIVQQYTIIYREAVQRYVDFHRATCKTAYILARSFNQIASQGFCTPAEKSAQESGHTEKLDEGTGLGDGEGAEDISKDIQDDEDLSELAQEPNTKTDQGEIEDEKDAVEMADDMEGELGDASEKGSDDDEGSDHGSEKDDIDEETGDVDNLDPTAVDEKLWDGEADEAEKDQEGDVSKGKPKKDEQVAGDDEKKKDGEEVSEGENDLQDDDVDEDGVDEEEGFGRDEPEQTDPHAREADALELPEDMDLDGDDKSDGDGGESDGIEDLSDTEGLIEEAEQRMSDMEGPDEEDEDGGKEEAEEARKTDVQEEGEGDEGDKTEDVDPDADADADMEDVAPDEEDNILRDQDGEAKTDAENALTSDVTGTGDGQEDDQKQDEDPSASTAQRDEGERGGSSFNQQQAAAEDGETGDQTHPEQGAAQQGEDPPQDTTQRQAFKKLGDALERWHKTQKKIQQAPDKPTEPPPTAPVGKEAQEFEHLADDEAEADTQALGAATEEQAHALDDSMAIDPESTDVPDAFREEESPKPTDADTQDINMDDVPPPTSEHDAPEPPPKIGTKIGQRKPRNSTEKVEDEPAHPDADEPSDLEDASTTLSSIHLDPSSSQSGLTPQAARQLWTHYEHLTLPLSQLLTEQLRLILLPSLATKLRGDFRTGKRLNMKRIIPYIASQYRRDKIWLRRSMPQKRAYQILLAVDDSSSMAEHGAGERALQTLVMVARSLAMLEVGEVGVVAFGEGAREVHAFGEAWSREAGGEVLRGFGFRQGRTDVRRLLERSLGLLREARMKGVSGGGSGGEMWQIMFVISDGLCEEREEVRRLVRQGMDERVMVVFLVVDNNQENLGEGTKSGDGGDGGAGGAEKSGKDEATEEDEVEAVEMGRGKGRGRVKKPDQSTGKSITTMTSAQFVPDGKGGFKIEMERYLDGFPFPYFIVVGDVRELPGVLGGALRQWIGEVEGGG